MYLPKYVLIYDFTIIRKLTTKLNVLIFTTALLTQQNQHYALSVECTHRSVHYVPATKKVITVDLNPLT